MVCRDLRLEEKLECVSMCVHFDDSRAISFSYLLMLYTTPVVSFLKKMNNVKKGLLMQEPIESIAFWQRVTTAPYRK